jgi:hypothetical protein
MIREPEPEPCTKVFYNLDEISYFIIFFGAGVGWFIMGFLFTGSCCWRRLITNNHQTILAESII